MCSLNACNVKNFKAYHTFNRRKSSLNTKWLHLIFHFFFVCVNSWKVKSFARGKRTSSKWQLLSFSFFLKNKSHPHHQQNRFHRRFRKYSFGFRLSKRKFVMKINDKITKLFFNWFFFFIHSFIRSFPWNFFHFHLFIYATEECVNIQPIFKVISFIPFNMQCNALDIMHFLRKKRKKQIFIFFHYFHVISTSVTNWFWICFLCWHEKKK